jgi:hypothetical protein
LGHGEIKLGCAAVLGQKQGRKKEGKEFLLLIFKGAHKKIEFKQRFEFKQTKTMQQHVCNIKPL